jgi:hypothetical protein
MEFQKEENMQEESLNKRLLSVDKDISLFKLLLTPMELYILKRFLSEGRPFNVGELYFISIHTIFYFVFQDSKNKAQDYIDYRKKEEKFYSTLLNAGYGYSVGLQNDKVAKIYKEVFSFKNSLSETELLKRMCEKMIEHKIKFPSYDKIKKIVEEFEKRGVLLRLKKNSKLILYTLSPVFFTTFKDKKQEILNL